MQNILFREKRLIDREEERRYIKDWFEKLPEEILWIYGPKSTGKTTIIEYIVENELFDDFKLFKSEKYNVKYINFRQKLFGNYDSFINSMTSTIDASSYSLTASFNLGFFKIESKLYEDIKAKNVDLFDVLFDELKQSGKRNVLIFDEIQSLENIYVDKERELLHEFLNFCVRLTKETHLSHVVLLSSNTIFINKIYNNAKLKVTSEFFKIDHLGFNVVKEWLNDEGFSSDDIDLIYDYLGGSIAHIQKLMRKLEQKEKSLKELLDEMVQFAWSEVNLFLEYSKKIDREEKKYFYEIIQDILNKGYYIKTKDDDKIISVIEKFCEIEILFFEPSNNRVYANSRVYEKAFERFIK
ncbi:ATP-binding protein [Hydrogenimonas thermophila]|uniref:ATP-binding protein n=1 Tax=Hydrogenimonas thermophila TaxID=223786 RepID=UPI002936E63B|nr:ATP-binding protein [Hydrogenimonas thermophila]WOE69017.1 ATP-binding protein [Hydrogenimonas thermophila]WOE71528.1 ATP-binding protein [Hydrogenimonas thermophila]